MKIEVRQAEGFFAKAIVLSANKDGVVVAYDGDWKPNETVAFDQCQIVPSDKSQSNLKVGQTVEAYFKKGGQPVEFWRKIKIQDIKGDFAVIEDINNPDFTSVVNLTECRPLGLAQPLEFHYHEIPVPAELKNYFSDPNSFDDLRTIVKNIIVNFDKDKMVLLFSSFLPEPIRHVKIVGNMYISSSKQKAQLLQRKEETKRSLNPAASRSTVSQTTAAHPTVVQKPAVDSSLVSEVFKVEKDLMGLSIGPRGSNISEARKIEGIELITYDESKAASDGFCTFTVRAKTHEAAEKARKMLEYVTAPVSVHRSMVGKLVGQNGKAIQEIVNNSGAARMKIVNSAESEDIVDFVFVGTREAIDSANLIMQFQIRHLQDMDAVRDEIEETKRQLNPSTQQGVPRRNLGVQSNAGAQNVRNQREETSQSRDSAASKSEPPVKTNEPPKETTAYDPDQGFKVNNRRRTKTSVQ